MAKQVKSKPAFKRKKPGNRAFLVVSQKVLQIFAVVGVLVSALWFVGFKWMQDKNGHLFLKKWERIIDMWFQW